MFGHLRSLLNCSIIRFMLGSSTMNPLTGEHCFCFRCFRVLVGFSFSFPLLVVLVASHWFGRGLLSSDYLINQLWMKIGRPCFFSHRRLRFCHGPSVTFSQLSFFLLGRPTHPRSNYRHCRPGSKDHHHNLHDGRQLPSLDVVCSQETSCQ